MEDAAWKFAGVVLRIIGILMMLLCVLMFVIFLPDYITGKAVEGGISLTILLTSTIFLGLPGYLLYRHSKKIVESSKNIAESNHHVTREVKQAKVVKDGVLLDPNLINDLVNNALSQAKNGNASSSSSYTVTRTISTKDMSPLDSEFLTDEFFNGKFSQQETAAASPQPRTVACKGCGANNVINSNSATCEYCGGLLD